MDGVLMAKMFFRQALAPARAMEGKYSKHLRKPIGMRLRQPLLPQARAHHQTRLESAVFLDTFINGLEVIVSRGVELFPAQRHPQVLAPSHLQVRSDGVQQTSSIRYGELRMSVH